MITAAPERTTQTPNATIVGAITDLPGKHRRSAASIRFGLTIEGQQVEITSTTFFPPTLGETMAVGTAVRVRLASPITDGAANAYVEQDLI